MFKNNDSNSMIPVESKAADSTTGTGNLLSSLNNDLPPVVVTTSVTDCVSDDAIDEPMAPSLAASQLARATLQMLQPPTQQIEEQLKEVIVKQNNFYIDLSEVKRKLHGADIARLQEMVNNVNIYRHKLLTMKQHIQSIYKRTKAMKKRAACIASYKRSEMRRKLKKEQQEQSLIGTKQQDNNTPNLK